MKRTAATTAVLLLVYLLASFFELTIDFHNWKQDTRGFTVFFWAITLFGSYVSYAHSKEQKEQNT